MMHEGETPWLWSTLVKNKQKRQTNKTKIRELMALSTLVMAHATLSIQKVQETHPSQLAAVH